jgi:hypothetical protein
MREYYIAACVPLCCRRHPTQITLKVDWGFLRAGSQNTNKRWQSHRRMAFSKRAARGCEALPFKKSSPQSKRLHREPGNDESLRLVPEIPKSNSMSLQNSPEDSCDTTWFHFDDLLPIDVPGSDGGIAFSDPQDESDDCYPYHLFTMIAENVACSSSCRSGNLIWKSCRYGNVLEK